MINNLKIKALEWLQLKTIKYPVVYFFIIKIYFMVLFSKDLLTLIEHDPDCEELEKIANHHTKNVNKVIFKLAPSDDKRDAMVKDTFLKNLIGDIKLK